MAATFKGEATPKIKKTVDYGPNDQIDCTIVYWGEETALQAMRPSIGLDIICDTVGNHVTVRKATLQTAAQGPAATLTITASNYTSGTGGGGSGPDVTYERTFERIEKDIRTHRAWQAGGTYPLSSLDFDQVNEWEHENSSANRAALYAALSANAQQLADRLQKGETTYPIWVPVASKTSNSTPQPTSTPPGNISSPPVNCNAPVNTALGKPYIYVRTVDDATRQSGQPWKRVEKWYGFDQVDTLIFTNA